MTVHYGRRRIASPPVRSYMSGPRKKALSVKEEVFYPGRVCWGIYDNQEAAWLTDCFDEPRLLFSELDAERWKWRTSANEKNPKRYEVRKYVIPERKT